MIETFKEIADRIQLSYKNSWDDVYCYDDDGIDVSALFGRQDMDQKVVDCFRRKNEKVEPLASISTYSGPITCPAATYATISSHPEPESINITFNAMDLKKIGLPISADARTTYDVKCVKNGSGYILEKVTATLNSSCFPPKEINDILKKDEEKETMPTKNDVMTFVWNKNTSNTSDPNSQEKESDPLHEKYPKLTAELKPKRIIFNNPATIVFWEDGTKTVVKLSKGEKFNSYNAFCAALAKKIFENNSRVRAIVRSGVNQHMKDVNKKKAKKTSKK